MAPRKMRPICPTCKIRLKFRRSGYCQECVAIYKAAKYVKEHRGLVIRSNGYTLNAKEKSALNKESIRARFRLWILNKGDFK